MKGRWIVLGATCIAGLAGVFAIAIYSQASPSKRVRMADGDPAARVTGASTVDGDLASLRHEMSLLKSERAAPARVSQTSHPGAAPLGSEQRAPSPEERAKSRDEEELRRTDEVQGYAKRLDEMMSHETRDIRWSRNTEQQIQQVVGAAGVGMALDNVNCTATLCKVVVKLSETATRQGLAMAVSSKEPFSNGTFYTYDGALATLYVGKEGWKMPGMVE